MQILLEIKNNNVLDDLLKTLERFQSEGVEIVKLMENKQYSDDYIKKNWKEMISKALANTDIDSDKWKSEYGTYLVETNK